MYLYSFHPHLAASEVGVRRALEKARGPLAGRALKAAGRV